MCDFVSMLNIRSSRITLLGIVNNDKFQNITCKNERLARASEELKNPRASHSGME